MSPTWSPAGRSLAFLAPLPARPEGPPFAVWLISVDQKDGDVRLGPPELLMTGPDADILHVSWDPGRAERLLLVSMMKRSPKAAVWELDTRSGRAIELVPTGCCGLSSAEASPDGRRIAFISYSRDKDGHVLIDSLDGTPAVDVACRPGWTGAAWSPDGRRLVLTSGGTTEGRLWLVDAPANGSRCSDPKPFLPNIHASAASWGRIAR